MCIRAVATLTLSHYVLHGDALTPIEVYKVTSRPLTSKQFCPAFHTGIHLRPGRGAPARATAGLCAAVCAGELCPQQAQRHRAAAVLAQLLPGGDVLGAAGVAGEPVHRGAPVAVPLPQPALQGARRAQGGEERRAG